jgi:hypothetical protein
MLLQERYWGQLPERTSVMKSWLRLSLVRLLLHLPVATTARWRQLGSEFLALLSAALLVP